MVGPARHLGNWQHAGVGDVKVVQIVAFAVSIHDGRGGIVSHAAGAAGANNTQRSFSMHRLHVTLGQGVRFDRFEGQSSDRRDDRASRLLWMY